MNRTHEQRDFSQGYENENTEYYRHPSFRGNDVAYAKLQQDKSKLPRSPSAAYIRGGNPKIMRQFIHFRPDIPATSITQDFDVTTRLCNKCGPIIEQHTIAECPKRQYY